MTTFEIKHVSNGIVDVFTGRGWKNWSRFQIEGNKLVLKKGSPVDKQVYKQLWEILL